MTDVRLTATNPDDSSVVPVACNSRGELLVTEPVIEQIDNNLLVVGTVDATVLRATRADNEKKITHGGSYAFTVSDPALENNVALLSWDGNLKIRNYTDGYRGRADVSLNENAFSVRTATGQLVWSVDYSGTVTGTRLLIHTDAGNPDAYVKNERAGAEDEQTYVGTVIDVALELKFLRDQVRALMEKLKMTPEGGWPVWDGSTET